MSMTTKTIEAKAKSPDMNKLIHWVSLAASDDETRYFMNALHVEAVDEQGTKDDNGRSSHIIRALRHLEP